MRILILLLILTNRVFAAGGVVGERGSCMIEIGLYTAHFTVYQSDTRGDEEFCEDLPDTGNTLFVLDYLHDSLKEVPLDFRIIRDSDELGIFARWEHVAAMTDLDSRTVFYQPPVIRADNQLTVEHLFAEPGWYIGVVTAPHPVKDIVYRAVFPFRVGRTPIWYWLLPLMVLAGLFLVWRKRRAVQDRK
jgi:hypothetical protein